MDRISIIQKYLLLLLAVEHPTAAESMRADLAQLKPSKPKRIPITFDRETTSWAGVTDLHMKTWRSAYPHMGPILGELSKAAAWLLAHPERVYRDYGAFLQRWMARADQSSPHLSKGVDKIDHWARSEE
jgi:hypothetical protein